MNFEEIIEKFLNNVKEKKIEIYNEFSLQFELGIFLKNEFKKYKVEFERNVSFFDITGSVKHEIDIVIYNENKEKKICHRIKISKKRSIPRTNVFFCKRYCFYGKFKKCWFH